MSRVVIKIVIVARTMTLHYLTLEELLSDPFPVTWLDKNISLCLSNKYENQGWHFLRNLSFPKRVKFGFRSTFLAFPNNGPLRKYDHPGESSSGDTYLFNMQRCHPPAASVGPLSTKDCSTSKAFSIAASFAHNFAVSFFRCSLGNQIITRL